MVAGAALLMRNPPEGYRPPGWEPSEAQKAQRSARDYTVTAGGRRGGRPGAVTGAATVAHHLNGEPPAQAGAGAGAVRVRP
jgi:hypothetical protein